MPKPLISIVICCHNRAHLLEQTLESVFAQTYQPVEIVVLDDGSTDGTPELITRHADKIRYFRQENSGIARARTAGCRAARGDYIAFQDDDDLMIPDRIQWLLDGLNQYPAAAMAVGDYAYIDPDGRPTGAQSRFPIHDEVKSPIETPMLLPDGYKAVLWPQLTPLPHTTLFRKKDGERIGWFDPHFFHACSDTDFFARLCQLGGVAYVPRIVSYYRCGHASIWKKQITATYSRFLLMEKHINAIQNKHDPLRKRLQSRLTVIMKRLNALKRKCPEDRTFSDEVLKNGLALLKFSDRLNYRLYTTFFLPIRSRLMGVDFGTGLIGHIQGKYLRPLFRKSN